METRPTPERRPSRPWGTALGVLAVFAVLGAGIVVLCEGDFSYSLDDPYIHLAVAEQLLHGHYGVNLSEPSSPSSSILYPPLLAVTPLPGLGQFGPVLVNLLATIGIILVLRWFVRGDRPPGGATAGEFLLLATLAFGTNLFGIAFTGMEHSIQVLASLLVLFGLIRTLQAGTVPGWFLAVPVVNPLVRFEGLALNGLSLLALAWLGHGRAAPAAGAATGLPVGGFMAWLVSMGLGPIPTSVLLKSTVLSAAEGASTPAGTLLSVGAGFYQALEGAPGALLAVAAAVLLLKPLLRGSRSRRSPEQVVSITVALAIAAHLAMGRFGWFSRYEIYILVLALAALLYTWREEARRLIAPEGRISRILLGLLALTVTVPWWRATITTPLASASIHAQQFRMRRFATEYLKRPVAVNDLGWVAFGNGSYVLDLWGLGSDEARRLRAAVSAEEVGWMERMVEEKDIHVAMIYADWFAGLPPDWRPLGVLRTRDPFHSVAETAGQFYAIPRADLPAVQAALRDLAKTLPRRARFDPAE